MGVPLGILAKEVTKVNGNLSLRRVYRERDQYLALAMNLAAIARQTIEDAKAVLERSREILDGLREGDEQIEIELGKGP